MKRNELLSVIAGADRGGLRAQPDERRGRRKIPQGLTEEIKKLLEEEKLLPTK